jgi:cytochrome b
MTSPELVSDFGATGLAPGGADVAAAPAAPTQARDARILLWDLPLRVFHWSLVAAATTAIVTGELGGSWMAWHGRAGLAIVALLVFRIVWGVVGSATSRFTQFAPTPAAVLRYLRGRWRGIGHNPLGALSVFALLGLLALQAGTGLFGNDDIAFAGPLNHLVDDALGSRLTGWHRLLANGLFVLLGLHLLAIAFHVLVKRHRLIRPMITGRLDVEAGTPLPAPVRRVRGALLVSVVLAAAGLGGVLWVGRAPVPTEPPPAAGPAEALSATSYAPAVSAPSW